MTAQKPITGPASPPASSELPPEAGPRLYGVIDVLRADRIAGWVIDRTDASAALDVEIRREGRAVATVRADRLRADLEKTGVGTGRYGFSCELDPVLEPGFEFTLTALARTPDGAALELRRSGSRNRDPERRLIERIYEEVTALRATQAAPGDALAGLLERVEVTQARLEAALVRAEPPAPASATGLRLLAGLAFATAAVSLGVGIASLLWP